MNAPFPWVGGKGKLLWIIDELAPYDYDCFVDVFGGSGTVLLNRPFRRGRPEIYNDRDAEIVNFMRVLKERLLALLIELQFLPYHSRDGFADLCRFSNRDQPVEDFLSEELMLADAIFVPEAAEVIKTIKLRHSIHTDVYRAAAFYKRQRYSFNGTGSSVAAEPVDLENFFGLLRQCSRRLQDVFIENMDFEPLIRREDKVGVFFYCDPPYYQAEQYYEGSFTEDDHRRLHKVLSEARGFVMVSYNDCPFIRALYQDFFIFSTERPDSLSHKKGQQYGELIMTNYDPRLCAAQLILSDQTTRYKTIHIPNLSKTEEKEHEDHDQTPVYR